ncbi:MAG: DUF2490 domain-containing protein [Proteobacteria bacterium]|nr:DUF2490 domain-containing protein [Pseudomonadota bacterium]
MKRIGNLVRYNIKVILMLLFLYFATPCLHADHDNSLRTDLNFNYTINERFLSTSYVFIQADKDMSNYDYIELGTGLQYQTSLKWLSFLLYYQQGYSKDDDNHWLLEQKPSINMNTLFAISGFKISNQIRYEYRITPDWNDYRIKNTLEISRPDIFLKPYIGWEMFYENHDRDVTLNRIKFGIIKDIDSHFSMGPYYRIDFSKINHQWEFSRQLVGFQVTIKY